MYEYETHPGSIALVELIHDTVQDFQLFRVWDSLILEDEELKKREWGVKHEGHMDGQAGHTLL